MIPNTNDSYQQLNGILNRITKVMMRKKKPQNGNNVDNNIGANQNCVTNPLVVNQNQNVDHVLQMLQNDQPNTQNQPLGQNQIPLFNLNPKPTTWL